MARGGGGETTVAAFIRTSSPLRREGVVVGEGDTKNLIGMNFFVGGGGGRRRKFNDGRVIKHTPRKGEAKKKSRRSYPVEGPGGGSHERI